MGWWGTAVGGTLGLLVGGPLGAVVGAVVGRGLDRGADMVGPFVRPGIDRQRLQERFFETVFSVMGHLSKCDGRVTEGEIAFAESVMERMSLSPGMRRTAILFFNQGKAPGFDLAESLAELRHAASERSPLLQLFLEIQMAAAYIDGEPNAAEREVLERIRRGLRISQSSFRRTERLVQLQHRFFGAGGAGTAGAGASGRGGSAGGRREAGPGTLAESYAVLGVDPKASDAEVKRAYRKLMNRHHPDKLVARGAPEEALKMASQKTQEIIRAYDTINRARTG